MGEAWPPSTPAGRTGARAAANRTTWSAGSWPSWGRPASSRPGYLLRALKEGKLGLFQTALAALGGFSSPEVRRACNAPDPELMALACAAVGIDRVVFPTLLVLVRELNTAGPAAAPRLASARPRAFSRDPANAARAFRDLVAGV